MEEPGSRELEIQRVRSGRRFADRDRVVAESPLTIYLNDQELVTLLCTPRDLKYLALGFLRSEGLINGVDDLAAVSIDLERGMVFVHTREPSPLAEMLYGKRTITSGCGKGTVFFHTLDALQEKPIVSGLQIAGTKLIALMRSLQEKSLLFQSTGGVHSAAIADTESILIYNEDIGRHNALDKLAGECLVTGIPLDDKVLLSSGRLSAEIVLKGAKMGLPLIVSRSAPTSLAVDMAVRMGITLVGFVRGARFNIYSHTGRIL